MRHLKKKNLKKFKEMFIDMNLNVKLNDFATCKSCVMKRMMKFSYYEHIIFKFTSLNLIHIDLCESFFVEKCNEKHYFLLIINDFTQ